MDKQSELTKLQKDEDKILIAKVLDKLKFAENRYALVIATSKRARQIAMGDEPLIDKREASPVTEAAEEIAEGVVWIC